MTEPHDVLEALLFASDAPVEAARIQEVLDLPSAEARARWSRICGPLRGAGPGAADHRGGRRLPPGDAAGGRAVARQARAEPHRARGSRAPRSRRSRSSPTASRCRAPRWTPSRGVNSEACSTTCSSGG